MDRNLLDKDKGNALYRKLADVLRQSFGEGVSPEGARLPTEFELSTIYGVSRGTVRQALSLLEEEGLIERVPGLGTFLRKHVTTEQANNQQRRIGVIVPFVHDQLSMNILVGVESVAKYRGYQVTFNHTHESLEQEKEDIIRMLKDQVAGMIIFPVSNTEYEESIWDLQEKKFPFVLVDRYFPNLDCDYVIADNLNGGYRATEHLILLGHKEIAFIYHPAADFRTTTVRDRYQGYRSALKDYHIDFQENWLVSIEDSPGMDAMPNYVEFLKQEDRLRAFVAVNDSTAINLVSAAASLGIKIPGGLVVVGFDNLKLSSQIQFPLTTINQDRAEIGVRAAHLLLSRIDGRVDEPEHIVLSTSLVVRESCGARDQILKNRVEG